MSIYTGVPDRYPSLTGTLNLGYTPIDGTRLSLFLRARRAVFGFNALGSPTFDNSNSTGYADSLLGRIGVSSKLFNGTYETSVFLGRLQDDRHYTEPFNPLDPNQQTNDSRYHSYRTDVQWNNTVHLSRPDRCACAVGDRPHLRLRAHRRQHQCEGEPVLFRLAVPAVGAGPR